MGDKQAATEKELLIAIKDLLKKSGHLNKLQAEVIIIMILHLLVGQCFTWTNFAIYSWIDHNISMIDIMYENYTFLLRSFRLNCKNENDRAFVKIEFF